MQIMTSRPSSIHKPYVVYANSHVIRNTAYEIHIQMSFDQVTNNKMDKATTIIVYHDSYFSHIQGVWNCQEQNSNY